MPFFDPSTGMAEKAGGDATMLTPPLVIADLEIDFMVRTARETLDNVRPNL
jgi:adenosylmethionine-8-amino-7-oxononanoate aminotransferase